MSEMSWSDAKLELFRFESNCAVRAGAGSGKTAALVELNLRLLSSGGIGIGDVLAMTFTDLAAGEMKERLCGMVDGRIRELAALCERGEAPESELWRWRDMRREFAGADISTINSFCLKILKENPMESRVDSFSVIDEIRSSDILDGCCSKTLMNFAEDRRFGRLFDDFGFEGLKGAVIRVLSSIRNCSSLERIKARTMETIERLRGDCYTGMLSKISLCISEIGAFCESLPEKMRRGAAASSYFRFAEPLGRFVHDVSFGKFGTSVPGPGPVLDNLVESLESIRAFCVETRNTFKDEAKDAFNALKGRVDGDPGLVGGKVRGRVFMLLDFFSKDENRGVLEAFFELAAAVEGMYADEKRRMRSVDFSDQIMLARSLLIRRRDVRRKYKERFRFVAVDEFQDVNRIQNDVVLLLCEKNGSEGEFGENDDFLELLSSGRLELEPRKLFIVGDLKQAIYSFRGGDVDVFPGMIGLMDGGANGRTITFDENFRSVRDVIDPLNDFFAFAMNVIEGRRQFTPSRGGVAGDDLRAVRGRSGRDSSIELVFPPLDGVEPGLVVSWLVAELPKITVVDRDSGSVRPARFGDAAILFKRATKVKSYVAELKRAGIPYVLENGKDFYGAEEVSDIMSVFRFLCGVDPEFYLACALRSPFCGISKASLRSVLRLVERNSASGATVAERFVSLSDSDFSGSGIPDDDSAALSRFRDVSAGILRIAAVLEPSALLKMIAGEFAYFLALRRMPLGASRIANVRKLFEIASKYESGTSSSNFDFIRYVESQTAANKEREASVQDSGAVRIMTVHKSKGMEFPVVLLCDVSGRNHVEQSGFYFCRDKGVGFKLKGGPDENFAFRTNALVEEVRNGEIVRENAESLRLLYVAATRAKDYLAVFLPFGAAKALCDDKREPVVAPMNWGSVFAAYLRGRGGRPGFLDSLTGEGADGRYASSFESEVLDGIGFKASTPAALSGNMPSSRAEEAVPADFTPVDLPSLRREIAAAVSPPAGSYDYLYLTPSKLLTWNLCRRRYLYELFKESGEGAFRGTQPLKGPFDDEALAKGSLAHYVLQDVNFNVPPDGYSDSLRRQAEGILKSVPEPGLPDALVDEVGAAVSRLFDFPPELREFFRPDSLFLPEHKIYFEVGESPSVYVDGVIDLLVRNSEGRIAVIDYKYGHNAPGKAAMYERQLYSYILGVSKSKGVRLEDLSAFIVFLRDRVSVYRLEVTGSRLERFEEELKRTAVEILSCPPTEDNYQRNPDVCRYMSCPYCRRCGVVK